MHVLSGEHLAQQRPPSVRRRELRVPHAPEERPLPLEGRRGVLLILEAEEARGGEVGGPQGQEGEEEQQQGQGEDGENLQGVEVL